MKKLLLIVFSLSFLSSCSNDKDFFITKENALISCGGKSRIIENENEEIINTEVKDLIDGIDGIGKYVEFTVVETDKKGGKYRIINCFPSEEPQDSIVKTIKTNYKLNNYRLLIFIYLFIQYDYHCHYYSLVIIYEI